MKQRGLALFFTLGVTLADWQRAGFLGREVKYYAALAERVGPVTWITYGGPEDAALAPLIAPIRLLHNPHGLPNQHFHDQISVLYADELSHIAVMKSNQVKGAQAAVRAARRFGAQSLVRGGYLLSRFYANRDLTPRTRFGLWRRELALFHSSDRISMPTAEDAAYLRRWYLVLARKVSVLPNFVDTGLFRPQPHIARRPGLIGCVGRLAPQKNLPALLEACAQVPGAHLRLIGDGPLRTELETLAASLNLPVEFCGQVDQTALPALLAECSLFTLPSLYEGLPKALLEAMACGLPVIATPVQGSAAVIDHKRTGWLCADASPQALREGIQALLADPELAERLGQQAAEHISAHYSEASVLTRELTLLQEMNCLG